MAGRFRRRVATRLLPPRVAALTAIWRAIRDSRRPGAPGLGTRLAAIPRLLVSTVRGEYDGLSARRLGLLVLAALYVISPFDVVPEGLLALLGLGDDVVVSTWLLGTLLAETERFLIWEGRLRTIPGVLDRRS